MACGEKDLRRIDGDEDRTHTGPPRHVGGAMHLSCIERPDEGLAEIEAAYFEREGDEWVFYVGQDEVFRTPVAGVVGIAKT
jgi:hypothetical protein